MFGAAGGEPLFQGFAVNLARSSTLAGFRAILQMTGPQALHEWDLAAGTSFQAQPGGTTEKAISARWRPARPETGSRTARRDGWKTAYLISSCPSNGRKAETCEPIFSTRADSSA